MIISKTPLRASLFGGGSDFKAYFENSVKRKLFPTIFVYKWRLNFCCFTIQYTII